MMNELVEFGENSSNENEEQLIQDQSESKNDFSYLTIDQLKSRLVAMGAELDTHRHTKSFYLDIYKEMMKDEFNREKIRDLIENDHKIFQRKAKKGKVCDNFMKNKRKRTEEEDTTKEEENNLNNPNKLENLKQNVDEFKEKEARDQLDINQPTVSETRSPYLKISPNLIKYISISTSNVSTPEIKESSQVYKDIAVAALQGQFLGLNFNPLVRVLDTDFSQLDKPLTLNESPFNYNRRQNISNNFTFHRVKKDNEGAENTGEPRYLRESDGGIRNVMNETEEIQAIPLDHRAPQQVSRRNLPRSQSFHMVDTTTTQEIYLQNKDFRGITYKIGKYLTLILSGSALILGTYYLLEKPMLNLDIDYHKIPKLKILIIIVVAFGILFLFSYLIKSIRESTRRNEELIAENILEGLKENLLNKIENGESNPNINVEEFIEEFCKSNKFKVDYFKANILPLIREFINDDQDTTYLSEKTFYESGKIKMLWEINSNNQDGI